jgi:hypothetical protein
MDANKIIDYLLEKYKLLLRENAFLTAKIEQMEEDLKRLAQSNDGNQVNEGAVDNA